MSGLFFRGTNADQDTRFSNKSAKLLKTHKFPPELDESVDFSKVQMDVIKPWIAKRVTELLGLEDEVVIDLIYNLLSEKGTNGRKVQIEITGFLEKNAGKFMKELWTLLLSAQKNVTGIPQQFLDEEAARQAKKKAAEAFLNAEFQKSKDAEAIRVKEKQEAADLESKQKEAQAAAARINANLKADVPVEDASVPKVQDAKKGGADRRSSSRSRSRSLSRSPSDRNDRRPLSPYSRDRRSRSPLPRRRRSLSRSYSLSPPPRRRSPLSRRRSPPGYASRHDHGVGSYNSRPLPYDNRRDWERDRDRDYRGRGSDRFQDRRDDGRRDPYDDRQRGKRDMGSIKDERRGKETGDEPRESFRDDDRGRSPEVQRKVVRGEDSPVRGLSKDRVGAERSEDESEEQSDEAMKVDKRKSRKEETDSEEDSGYGKRKARGPDGHGSREAVKVEDEEEDGREKGVRKTRVIQDAFRGRRAIEDSVEVRGEKERRPKIEQERELKTRGEGRDDREIRTGGAGGKSSGKRYSEDEEEENGEGRRRGEGHREKGRDHNEKRFGTEPQMVKNVSGGTQGKGREAGRYQKPVSSSEEDEGRQERGKRKSYGEKVVKVEAGIRDDSEEKSIDTEDERQRRKGRWQEVKDEKAQIKHEVSSEKEDGADDDETMRKRKEEKRKRKEERRIKRELKRKRQEEKKRSKEDKKRRTDQDSEEEGRNEDVGRQKEIEETLRKKVMESLKAKKHVE